MKRRTFVVGMGTAAAGGSALLGSGAFSRTEPQRNVVIETVGDEDAYMRLVYDEILEFGCEGELTLRLTNQFKEGALSDITVTFTAENDNVTLGDPVVAELADESEATGSAESSDESEATGSAEPSDAGDEVEVSTSLEQGEEAEITLPVECNTEEETTTTVTFDVEGGSDGSASSVIVEDREVELTCSCAGTGISFIAFCGDVDEGDVEFTVDTANDSVEWELLNGTLGRIVLYGGFSSYDYGNGPYFLNFNNVASDGTSGTVQVGGETEALSKDDAEDEYGQTPSCPCYGAESGVKFNISDDGTVKEVDDGCGGNKGGGPGKGP